jgi:hypothetical protein
MVRVSGVCRCSLVGRAHRRAPDFPGNSRRKLAAEVWSPAEGGGHGSTLSMKIVGQPVRKQRRRAA